MNPAGSAETTYLFRHALLRDAAYQLQPPRERANLHGLAFKILEAVLVPVGEDALNSAALELAEHAAIGKVIYPELSQKEASYLALAFDQERRRYATDRICELGERVIGHPDTTVENRLAYSIQLAYSYVNGGEANRALKLIDPALNEARRLRDERILAGALSNRGFIKMRLGAPAEAEENFREAMLIAERNDDKFRMLNVKINLAALYIESNRVEEAEALLVQGEQLAIETKDARSAALVASNLALISRLQKRWVEAETRLREALELAEQAQVMGAQLSCHSELAVVLDVLGREAEAEAEQRTLLKMAQLSGLRRYEAIALGGLSQRAFDKGEVARAAELCDEALAVAEAARMPSEIGPLRARAAFFEALNGNRAAAEGHWNKAMSELSDAALHHVAEECIEQMKADTRRHGLETFAVPTAGDADGSE